MRCEGCGAGTQAVFEVYLFGSRAKGGASEVSDLDLAIVARDWDDNIRLRIGKGDFRKSKVLSFFIAEAVEIEGSRFS